MKTIIVRIIYCFVLVTGLHFLAVAQPEDNGGDPPPSDVPLDGGSSVLLAAGVAYGIKQVKKHRRKNPPFSGKKKS